jgi:hypothetical protein
MSGSAYDPPGLSSADLFALASSPTAAFVTPSGKPAVSSARSSAQSWHREPARGANGPGRSGVSHPSLGDLSAGPGQEGRGAWLRSVGESGPRAPRLAPRTAASHSYGISAASAAIERARSFAGSEPEPVPVLASAPRALASAPVLSRSHVSLTSVDIATQRAALAAESAAQAAAQAHRGIPRDPSRTVATDHHHMTRISINPRRSPPMKLFSGMADAPQRPGEDSTPSMASSATKPSHRSAEQEPPRFRPQSPAATTLHRRLPERSRPKPSSGSHTGSPHRSVSPSSARGRASPLSATSATTRTADFPMHPQTSPSEFSVRQQPSVASPSFPPVASPPVLGLPRQMRPSPSARLTPERPSSKPWTPVETTESTDTALLQQTAAVITAAVTSLEEPLRATMALIGNERPTLVHDSNALSEALARLSEGIEALASQLDGAKATQERQSAQLQRATAAVQYWKNEALELRGGE